VPYTSHLVLLWLWNLGGYSEVQSLNGELQKFDRIFMEDLSSKAAKDSQWTQQLVSYCSTKPYEIWGSHGSDKFIVFSDVTPCNFAEYYQRSEEYGVRNDLLDCKVTSQNTVILY
jgi:hypothetical protein